MEQARNAKTQRRRVEAVLKHQTLRAATAGWTTIFPAESKCRSKEQEQEGIGQTEPLLLFDLAHALALK
jgi:hypothetical protein